MARVHCASIHFNIVKVPCHATVRKKTIPCHQRVKEGVSKGRHRNKISRQCSKINVFCIDVFPSLCAFGSVNLQHQQPKCIVPLSWVARGLDQSVFGPLLHLLIFFVFLKSYLCICVDWLGWRYRIRIKVSPVGTYSSCFCFIQLHFICICKVSWVVFLLHLYFICICAPLTQS